MCNGHPVRLNFQPMDGDQSAIVSRAASVRAITTGNAQMAEGTIKRLTDKGYGFISTGGAKDLFFHSSSVQGCSFEELREGQTVSFTEGQGKKGPCAGTLSRYSSTRAVKRGHP